MTPPYTMDNIQPRVPGVLELVVVGPGEWEKSRVGKSGSGEEMECRKGKEEWGRIGEWGRTEGVGKNKGRGTGQR